MAAINRDNYPIYFIDYYDKRLSQQQIAELKTFLRNNPDLQEEFDTFPKLNVSPPSGFSSPDFSYLKKDIATLEINTENADELIISLLEGDYPSEKQTQLKQWIESDQNNKTNYEKLSSARLIPAPMFFEKASLYRLPDFENEPVNFDNAPWFAVAMLEGDLSEDSIRKYQAWLACNPQVECDFSQLKLIPDLTIRYSNSEKLKYKRNTTFKAYAYSIAVAASIALLIGVFRTLTQIPAQPEENIVQLTTVEDPHTSSVIAQDITVTAISESTPNRKIIHQTQRNNQQISAIEIIKLNLDTLYTVNYQLAQPLQPTDMSYTLALEPEPDEKSELPTSETFNFVFDENLIERVGSFLATYTQNTIVKSNLAQTLKVKIERNEHKEMVYLSIKTPVFAIERKNNP